MKKNVVKIVLDVVILLLLFLMYQKQVISLSFHEIGGLAVCGLFLVHKALNWKWICGVTRKLFSKSMTGRARLSYLVNVLMLLSFLFILISGVLISKTILTGISVPGHTWKAIHYFASALAIILCGIHIGLHRNYIKNVFGKTIRLPKAVALPLSIILLAVVLAYGCYSAATSSFISWLAAPFQESEIDGFGNGTGQGGEGFGQGGGVARGNEPIPGSQPQSSTTDFGAGRKGQGGASGSGLIVISPGDLSDENVNGQFRSDAVPGLHEQFEEADGSVSFVQILSVLATYASIAAVFAIITAFVEFLVVQRKRAKQ